MCALAVHVHNLTFKGTGSKDRIQVFEKKLTGLVVVPLLVFECSKCSSDD
jgi:hypothetical protein